MRLNPYKIMWLYLFFDLPVVESEERREATQFRNFLLDQGFTMGQFSVYYKFAGSTQERDRLVRLVEGHLPRGGKVDILSITDKQYGGIISFRGQQRRARHRTKKEDPYLLF